MGQAIQYALNQWEALCVFTTDGTLAMNACAAESALRRVALGGQELAVLWVGRAGRTAAVHFSLIATRQRHWFAIGESHRVDPRGLRSPTFVTSSRTSPPRR